MRGPTRSRRAGTEFRLPANRRSRPPCGSPQDLDIARSRRGRVSAGVTVHIGTSGWSYDHWDGVLYPPAPRRARLAHYVRGSAPSSSTPALPVAAGRSFAGWRAPPPGFQLTVKAPRGLTHAKRLTPRAVAAAAGLRLAPAGRPARGAARAAAPGGPRDDPRLGVLPEPAAALDAGGGRVPPPELARRGGLRPARRHRGGLLRDERGHLPCVLRARPPSSTSGCTAPTPGTSTPAPTPTPTCAGGPTGWGSGPGGPGRVRVLQQRRPRPRRPQRRAAAGTRRLG